MTTDMLLTALENVTMNPMSEYFIYESIYFHLLIIFILYLLVLARALRYRLNRCD